MSTKKILTIPLLCACILLPVAFPRAAAADAVVGASPPATATPVASPIIFTAFKSTSRVPTFVQLYNNSDIPANVEGWKLQLVATSDSQEVDLTLATLHAWIIPRGYFVVSAQNAVSGADITFQIPDTVVQQLALMPNETLSLTPPDQTTTSTTLALTDVPQTGDQWWQRKQSSGKYVISGKSSDFTVQSGAAQLYGNGLYAPPDTVNVQVVELLPNARTCPPLDTSTDCNDYVKLYNPTQNTVDLTNFRLRSNSGGLTSTKNNTLALTRSLAPGAYIAEPIDLTNSGGYAWLEDTYGVRTYQPIYNYPDASDTSKKDQSWAWDPTDNTWKWMTPAPTTANYWPPATLTTTAATTVTDCGQGRERNPATGRCRTVITASSTSLQPCAANQERNPATNRCKAVAAASTTLAPCQAGQERNPATNRCKAAASTSNGPKPCPAGQTRNASTNRCRKVTSASPQSNIKDVATDTAAPKIAWWAAGVVGVAALGYGLYEWRHDAAMLGANLKRRLQKTEQDA